MNNVFLDDRKSFHLKDYQEEIGDDLGPWKYESTWVHLLYFSFAVLISIMLGPKKCSTDPISSNNLSTPFPLFGEYKKKSFCWIKCIKNFISGTLHLRYYNFGGVCLGWWVISHTHSHSFLWITSIWLFSLGAQGFAQLSLCY